ncbi:hypothetical protein KQI77_05665 [Clostridium sp. MSJ-8]|uniref:hypothetical protein n=1 Tax=Clostridium sp. MSJ-8 TaxID=2841510 RepID=UPI001C0EFB5F|nr:hypothetical protein [Clostridium sp. MSJ-8]MBU5487652.1 hypothetical protein [Clostridium sp. MSJ-8]
MNRKKIFSILLAATLVFSTTSMIGCGKNKTDDENNNNSVAEDVKDTADEAAGETEKLFDKVTDRTMEYTAADLKTKLEEKGYDVSKEKDAEDYFTTKGKVYDVDGDTLYVYEYGEKDNSEIEKDINSIDIKGNKIGEKNITWKATPHMYKKGRVVVMYDGDNKGIINTLKETLGDPFVG